MVVARAARRRCGTRTSAIRTELPTTMRIMPTASTAPFRARTTIQFSGAQRLFAFATLMGLAGAVLWLGPLHAGARPNAAVSIPWWGELLACYIGGLLAVHVPGTRRATVSFAEVPVALGLFVVDPWLLLGCYTVGGLMAQWTRRGLRPSRDYGNVMLDVLFVAVAVLVFTAAHPSAIDPLAPRSVLALVAAMAVAGGVLGSAALVTSVALYQGRLRPRPAATQFLTQAAGTITSTCVALILLALASVRPWLVAAALPPAVLVIALQRAAQRARRRSERTTFLHRVGDILGQTAPLEVRVEALLGAVTGAFGAGPTALVLLSGPGVGAVRFRASGRTGGLQVSRGELSAAEQDALRTAAEHGTFVVRADDTQTFVNELARDRGLEHSTVFALRGHERTVGLLFVQRDALSRRDLDDLAAAATFIGAAAERGELTPVERRRGDGSRRSRGGGPLTVHDRPSFVESVAATLSRVSVTRRPAAVLLIDLDAFLGIRGTYGDTVGQAVLHDVARRVQRHLRRYDVVGRLGPEQIGILLDGLRERRDAEVVGRRILDALQKSFNLNGDSVAVGASIGIAVIDDFADVPAPDEVLRRADMAVYLAKRQAGVRCLVFDAGSRAPVITSKPALRS